MKEHLYGRNILITSHDIYRYQNEIVHDDDVFTISHTLQKYKYIIFKLCLLTLTVDILINSSIDDFIFVTYATKNSIEFSTAKFDRNWAYAQAQGSSTIGVGWSSASFPTFGYSFKCKSRWTSLPHVKIINSTLMCSTISSTVECT